MKYLKWFAVILTCLATWVVLQIPDGKLHVIFCDVGQGDAELITKGSVQILIDGGPNGDRLIDCLSSHMPFWDRTIEVVMNSHPQADHANGLSDVIERYRVLRFVRATWPETTGAKRLLKLIDENKIKSEILSQGEGLKVSGLKFEVLWPPKGFEIKTEEDENASGLVVKLIYDRFTAIFTGDIGVAEELALIGRGVITPMEVLKGAHHGSKYSSSIEFVEKLRPKLVVFEVGANNSYGHPNGDILKRFDIVGAKVKRTDKDGVVEVITDGGRWWTR